MLASKLTEHEKKELYEVVVPIAKKERGKIIYDDKIIEDTFCLIEQLGFFILKFPSKDENISGFHIKKSGLDCIYINSAHTLGRQNFSAWHEYYHAVTGEGGGLSFYNKREADSIEYKAECFAGCILMPEDLVEKYLNTNRINNLRYISHENIIKMQSYFNVSYSAVVSRLIQLYPDNKKDLVNRYALSSKARAEELYDKTVKANGNLKLISPTNNVYVSQSFFEDLRTNLSKGKISDDKANSLINLLEELKIDK